MAHACMWSYPIHHPFGHILSHPMSAVSSSYDASHHTSHHRAGLADVMMPYCHDSSPGPKSLGQQDCAAHHPLPALFFLSFLWY